MDKIFQELIRDFESDLNLNKLLKVINLGVRLKEKKVIHNLSKKYAEFFEDLNHPKLIPLAQGDSGGLHIITLKKHCYYPLVRYSHPYYKNLKFKIDYKKLKEEVNNPILLQKINNRIVVSDYSKYLHDESHPGLVTGYFGEWIIEFTEASKRADRSFYLGKSFCAQIHRTKTEKWGFLSDVKCKKCLRSKYGKIIRGHSISKKYFPQGLNANLIERHKLIELKTKYKVREPILN